MKKRAILIILCIITISCTTNPSGEESQPKMVPDRTPYIAGLIEASNDTLHHYPEVVVGYVTDSQNFDDPNILNSYPEIYSPTLLTQVVKTSFAFSLGFDPEADATVLVRGPIGKNNEQEIIFSHKDNGVYGDVNSALPLEPNGEYTLNVTLPDGREYVRKTYIPEATSLILPDSIRMEVEYKPYGDGTPREESVKPYPIVFNYPDMHFLTVLQYNSDKDRELLLLEPDEGFRFTDRSSYLRTGIGYSISLSSNASKDTLPRHWGQRLDKPKEEVWKQKHWWLRFSYFSEGIGRMYFPPIDFFSAGQKWIDQMHTRRLDAVTQNDSTYLFDVSTIRKLSADGRMLPKDSSDAIGFFSGYYSTYRQTTLYPIRNFDLDSVLTSTEAN